MNGLPMPILKIEIDRLKERVTHALVIHEHEISEAVSKAIDKAVASFPFEEEVERIVHKETREAVERYFRMGEGRKAIDAVIDRAFSVKE